MLIKEQEDYIYNIIEQWQSGYCAGAPMSNEFRLKATEIFALFYNCQSRHKFTQTPDYIYRVIEGEYIPNNTIQNVYYSFSRDLESVITFASKDKRLHSDISLIIATPKYGLNFNAIMYELYENYGEQNRYYNENEILSYIDNNITSIIHFNTLQELIDFAKTYKPH